MWAGFKERSAHDFVVSTATGRLNLVNLHFKSELRGPCDRADLPQEDGKSTRAATAPKHLQV